MFIEKFCFAVLLKPSNMLRFSYSILFIFLIIYSSIDNCVCMYINIYLYVYMCVILLIFTFFFIFSTPNASIISNLEYLHFPTHFFINFILFLYAITFSYNICLFPWTESAFNHLHFKNKDKLTFSLFLPSVWLNYYLYF